MSELPLPPVPLANRVGQLVGDDGSYADYERVGAGLRSVVDAHLPTDWTWEGKRTLDFGAGSGRVLRHFLPEADRASFVGCDIDAEAITWLNENLSPPFRGVVNGETPPLPFEDDSFDVVYAFSVFTHITSAWAAWLVELHRVLAPGGWLIASYLGAGMSRTIAGEDWDADRIGMNVLHAHQDWHAGGPSVLLSPWWIREHWGRAFDIVQLGDAATEGNQNVIVARARDLDPSVVELERVDPSEPRELGALRHQVQQLQREARDLQARLDDEPSVPARARRRLAGRLKRLV